MEDGCPARGDSTVDSAQLLVGYYESGTLHYAGRVGSGLDENQRSVLEEMLASLARDTSPFDKTPKLPEPHWVEPELVVDVRFQNWTGAGILRRAALPRVT